MKTLGKTTEYKLTKPDPNVLDTFPNPGVNLVTLHQKEFTSICPITGQPDYGEVEVIYLPNEICLESKSLKLYLMSYRNYGAFCESLAKLIWTDLTKVLNCEVFITVTFVSRGGITIKAEVNR